MTNLDHLAARHGQSLGFGQPAEEKIITSALSILHEQGIYAMFLWLYAKSDERGCIGQCVQNLFSDPESPVPLNCAAIWAPQNTQSVTTAMSSISSRLTEDLKTMFFAKDLINATLIYARHAVKARGGNQP